MEKVDMSYLAGLFDGEGSFSIQVNVRERKGIKSVHFNPRMSMSLKYGNDILKEYVSFFGGNLYYYDEGVTVRWSLNRKDDLIIAATKIEPFLHIKNHIALNFLEAMNTFPKFKGARASGERSWTPEMTQKVAKIALSLNPPTARKSHKDLDYLKELDAIYESDEVIVDET